MSTATLPAFTAHDLGDGLTFLTGKLPAELVWDADAFERAWALHPEEKPSIHMHGKRVQIPRWQQAYGADYHFSGQTSRALPVPEQLEPLLRWARETVHPALNALLLNWYEGPGHYIGPHHDSVKFMAEGAPIVTLSFGEARKFRMTKGKPPAMEVRDFVAQNGAAFVLPRDTNAVWKHSVPKSTRYSGRRISVTVRGFVG